MADYNVCNYVKWDFPNIGIFISSHCLLLLAWLTHALLDSMVVSRSILLSLSWTLYKTSLLRKGLTWSEDFSWDLQRNLFANISLKICFLLRIICHLWSHCNMMQLTMQLSIWTTPNKFNGAKLTYFRLRCQIDLVPNWPGAKLTYFTLRCHIDCGAKLTANMGGAKLT